MTQPFIALKAMPRHRLAHGLRLLRSTWRRLRHGPLFAAGARRSWCADLALRHGWFRVLLQGAVLVRTRRNLRWHLRGMQREFTKPIQKIHDRLRSIFRRKK